MARTPEQIQETVDAIIFQLATAEKLEEQARALRRRAQERCAREIFNGIFLHSDCRRLLEVDEGRGMVRELTSVNDFAAEEASGQISPQQAEQLMRRCAAAGIETFEYNSDDAMIAIDGRTFVTAFEAECYLASLPHVGQGSGAL